MSSINDPDVKHHEQTESKKGQKPNPINKYSVHELKSAIDTKIIEFLEENKFVENHYLSNIKIAVGLFCLSFTALAYLYPKPFPQNYNVVLFSVIMYMLGSLVYYYVEKFMIKQIIYTGNNEEYIAKLRQGKREKLKYFTISSEIKSDSQFYELWFEFVNVEGLKISSEKFTIDCTTVCDERGYVIKNLVDETFQNLFNDQLTKKII